MTEIIEDSDTRWASHSSLVKHRDCPQKWHYGHVRKLEKIDPEDVAIERDFGSWWHALRAADSIDRGRRIGSLKYVPEEITTTDDGPKFSTKNECMVETVLDGATRWNDAQHPELRDMWVSRIGGELPDRLAYVFNRWNERWADEIRNEEPLAVEFGWKRKLPPMPASWMQAGVVESNTVLVGYIDEIYYDRRRALVVARDHKTSKTLSIMHVGDDMMDSQLQLYAWGSAPEVLTWGRGQIGATAYDRARMSAPSRPAVTATGGTLSKSTSDYDLFTYQTWATGPDGQGVPWGEEGAYFLSGPRKDKPKFGRYVAEPAVIERLSTPAAGEVWFQRTLTPLNPTLIKAHLRAAVDSATDMRLTSKRIEQTGEAPRNISAGDCRWCDFAGLCRAEMIGGADGEWNLDEFKLRVKPKTGR